MKILSLLKIIKEYQVSILIVFIIASILYGIHMFRYEYVKNHSTMQDLEVYRIDRITNEVCLYIFPSHLGGSTNTAYKEGLFKMVEPCD